MRVLFVSHSLPLAGRPLSNLGGMQRLALEQCSALAEHPAIELTPLLLRSGAPWTQVRTGAFLARLLRQVPALVRRERVEVVLFSSMVTAAIAPLLRSRLEAANVLVAATPVGRDVTLPNVLYQKCVPRIFSALDLVLPISRATAEACRQRGVPARKLEVVPCGIDLSRVRPPADRLAARRRLLERLASEGHPVPEGAFLLLSVGRHQERKGFHWFVEEVLPRTPASTVYLLAGSGPMTPRIQEAVRRAGLTERVRLLGRVGEDLLTQLYQGADLFVMPNIPVPGDIEGFGIVMLEAGAAGLPVVAADLEGIREVIRAPHNGRLFPAGHADAALDVLRSYTDGGLSEDSRQEAARYLADTFAWPRIVDRYVKILGDRLAARTGLAPHFAR